MAAADNVFGSDLFCVVCVVFSHKVSSVGVVFFNNKYASQLIYDMVPTLKVHLFACKQNYRKLVAFFTFTNLLSK